MHGLFLFSDGNTLHSKENNRVGSHIGSFTSSGILRNSSFPEIDTEWKKLVQTKLISMTKAEFTKEHSTSPSANKA